MVDYEALEQEKRKKLFAKKAALKARNQRQAQNLESELESLFASSGPPLESTEALEDEVENAIVASESEPLAKRPRHSLANPEPTSSSQAEHLHSLRESIDHTEETAQPPPAGPFAYNPSFARANHSHQPPSSSTTNRRPVATDLEHLPSHRLSENALSRQRVIGGFGGSLFNGGFDAGESLIIEISDDEDDERIDMKDGEGDVRMSNGENQPRKEDSTSTPQRVPSPSDSRSIWPSIPANASSSSKAAQVGEILRQRQLEEKELEIKRIMDRIKDMESRKKRATSAVSEDVSVTSERVVDGPAASKQSTANGARQVDSRSFPPSLSSSERSPCSTNSTFSQNQQQVQTQTTQFASSILPLALLRSLVIDFSDSRSKTARFRVSSDTITASARHLILHRRSGKFPIASWSFSRLNSFPSSKPSNVVFPSIPSPISRRAQVYRPYNSTLSRYPLLGGRPSTSLSIPFHPSPLSSSDFPSTNASSTEGTTDFVSDVGSAGLSTFVAHKHKLDPARKWCKAESLGGVCQDGTCKSVHERDFVARGTSSIHLTIFHYETEWQKLARKGISEERQGRKRFC